MCIKKWYRQFCLRGILYAFILLFGSPILLAYRMIHVNPRDNQAGKPQLTNPLLLPLKSITLTTEDGLRIHGRELITGAGKRLLIIIHGYGMYHADMINRAKGIFPEVADICFLDIRNHGFSDNSQTTFGFKEALDVQAAIKHYRSQYNEIVLWGFSMGAAASIRAVLLGNPVDMLILEGMYDDLSNAIYLQAKRYYFPKYPIVSMSLFFYEWFSGVNLDEMNMAMSIKKIKDIPILLVHSKADLEVPMFAYKRLKEALGQNGYALLLETGSHEYIYEDNAIEYRNRVIEFIENHSYHRMNADVVSDPNLIIHEYEFGCEIAF